jgi:hypothetical protein
MVSFSSLARSGRIVVAVSLGLVLLAGGCSFEDFFSGSDSRDDTAQRETAPPTQTAWRYVTPTSTVPPTMTPWIYVPMTATRTASPTHTPTRTPTPRPTATPSPTPSPTPVVNLLGSLPSEEDVPDGMRLEREEATLTADQVADEVEGANRSEYLRLLDEWDFRGGSLREYQVPSPGVGEFLRDLLGLEARGLEFGSEADALAAIEYQREFARNRPGWDLEDADVEPLGDASFALTGTADYDGTEVSVAAIFVQDGNRVYRFVGVGGLQKPFDETLKIAKQALS